MEKEQLERVKASKAEKKKRKSKSKAAKKKRNEGANKASSSSNLPGSSGAAPVSDSSSSEERSPLLETGTRSKRVNFLGTAKKATVFKYPALGMIHEAVEELPVEEVREQVLKACTAKTNAASPVLKGTIFKHKNELG